MGEKISVSVKFRIVSVNVNFHPLNETVSLITMGKVGRNRQKVEACSCGEPETNMRYLNLPQKYFIRAPLLENKEASHQLHS